MSGLVLESLFSSVNMATSGTAPEQEVGFVAARHMSTHSPGHGMGVVVIGVVFVSHVVAQLRHDERFVGNATALTYGVSELIQIVKVMQSMRQEENLL